MRDAMVDYFRRNAARDRAHEQFAAGVPVSYETELQDDLCQCVAGVLDTLLTPDDLALSWVLHQRSLHRDRPPAHASLLSCLSFGESSTQRA